MPQYLADLLAGFPGFRGTVRSRNMLGDEEVPMPGREEVTGLGGTGSVGPRDLLSPASAMRSDTALADAYAASGGGRSSREQFGSVAPPSPDIIRRAQQMAARDMARPAPVTSDGGAMPPLNGQEWVTPHPMPPDVPMAGGPGVPPPMGRPQAGGQPQPGAMTPAGVQRPDMLGGSGGTDLLGRAKKWLGGEAFPAGQGMSRGMVLAQMLGQFGAGLSQTGRVGPGLQAANETMMDLRQGERKFRQDEQENRYKTMTAEAQLARALRPGANSSSPFERMLAAAVADGSMTEADAVKLRQQKLTADATEQGSAEKLPTTPNAAILASISDPQERARMAQQLLEQERSADMARAAASRSTSSTTVNLPAGESEFAKAEGKALGELAAAIPAKIEAAGAAKANIASMRAVQEVTPQGPGEWAKDYLRGAGEMIGVPTALPARQAFNAMANKLVVAELGGLGTAISNSDREFIAQAFPNANLTPATNKVLLDVAERVQDRKIALEEMRSNWIKEHKSLVSRDANGKTFAQATADLARTNVVSPEEKAAIKAALSGEPTVAPDIAARVGKQATEQEKASLPRANNREEALALPAGQPFVGAGDIIGIR